MTDFHEFYSLEYVHFPFLLKKGKCTYSKTIMHQNLSTRINSSLVYIYLLC